MMMKLFRHLLLAFLMLILVGCEPYRIEYHSRPSFYRQAGVTDLPDREVLEDGTVVIYETKQSTDFFQSQQQIDEEGQPLPIREEYQDDTVLLRCFLPEHVVENTLICLHNEEYQLIYDQLLAEETRDYYERLDEGYEEFENYFRKYRLDIARLLNRMLFGLHREEVETLYVGTAVCFRLRSHVADPFRFRQVEMVREEHEMKLLKIQ